MVSRCVLLLTSRPSLSSLRGKPREIALFFSSFEIKGVCFQTFLSLTTEDMPEKKNLVKYVFVGVVDLSYAE